MKILTIFFFIKKNISFLFLIVSLFSLNAQIKIKGKVVDSINNPLQYANIFAVPLEEKLKITYAITNKKGNYTININKNKTYKITISYLGFIKQEVNFNFTKDTIYNFVLKEDKNQLDEVELTYTIPIVVKKDTITYNVDSFVTGEERKLKDVLKKLPGIEVDRKGNVTANGKTVKKLLVENKPFFGGNTKLGVNNIPADAIDKVQILDEYSEVAMLKGLQDSDDTVLNIKLKEDKKKFVFGDLEVGTGVKERYLLHPKLFYYSPKTSVNFIGDINNYGKKSFTFKEYLDFEGGFSRFIGNPSSYFDLYNSDFSRFLANQDFVEEKQTFGAFNIRHSISSSSDLSTYIISSKSETKTERNSENTYFYDIPFIEKRTNTNSINRFFTIGKITLDYDPNPKTDFAFTSFIKLTDSKSKGVVNTNNSTQDLAIETKSNLDAFTFKQNINLNKDISKKHTITFDANYTFKHDKPNLQWVTNQEILEDLIPLQNANIFNIIQTKKFDAQTINATFKDYWVLHRFHHLYTSIGTNIAYTNFFSQDVQLLDNGTINNFNTAGFGNDFDFNFLDNYIGLEYKFMLGNTTFKPALFYHNYQWSTKQFSTKQKFNKNLFLPQFTTKVEFGSSEKLNLRYRLNASFPNTKLLANNFILSSFNSVYRGNNNLENNLYHSLNINYYKFNLYKGYQFHLGTFYNNKIKSIKSISNASDINQFTTSLLFKEPEQSWASNVSFSKLIKKIRYKLKANYRYNDYFQLVNNTQSKNITKTISIEPSIKTSFKKLPNLELIYKKDFTNYTANNSKSKFGNETITAFIEYDFLNDFIFTSDFNYSIYKNESTNVTNEFTNLDLSLFYQKENSPWGFELNATNLFDTKFKQSNSISEFIISDSKTFILPRITMFKVIYKL